MGKALVFALEIPFAEIGIFSPLVVFVFFARRGLKPGLWSTQLDTSPVLGRVTGGALRTEYAIPLLTDSRDFLYHICAWVGLGLI